MINTILRTLFATCLLLQANNVCAQEIPWSVKRPLAWTDFKGQDPHNDLACLSTYIISYEYKMAEDSTIHFTVFCSFDQAGSWRRATEISTVALRHQQRRFDIAELYARKMRKAFTTYTLYYKGSGDIKGDMNKIFERLWAEMGKYADKYDTETAQATIDEKELEWDKKIKAELKALDGYESK